MTRAAVAVELDAMQTDAAGILASGGKQGKRLQPTV